MLMAKGLSALLIAFIVLITFPVWIGLIAGGFGLIVGLFGAIFGVIAAVFGVIFGIIGAIFEAIFGGMFSGGWPDAHIHFPRIHMNGYAWAALIIVVALVISNRNKKSE